MATPVTATHNRILMAALAAGFALRLREAWTTYLNPDEVLLALSGQAREIGFSVSTADHPPLLGVVLAAVSAFSISPLALRLPAILAGTLAPLVFCRWLTSAWNARAGTVALLILTFAPNLVSLGAQARGYALLMLFCTLALRLFDDAVRNESAPRLAAFHVLLYLAILTEYSAAWFVGAMGVYGILQLWRRPRRLFALWALGQCGALALYWWLMRLAPEIDAQQKQLWMSSFLLGAFPNPGEHLSVFVALGTLKQFAYLFGSVAIGALAAIAFAIGLLQLWRKPAVGGGDTSGRALAALLVVPFVLAASAALLELHPYGRSRHTVVLSLFIAAGVSIGLSRLTWPKGRWAIGSVVAGLAIWSVVAEPDQNDIAASRHRASSLERALTFLHDTTTTGSIVTDRETALLLRYATNGLAPLTAEDSAGMTTARMGGLRVGWRHWTLDGAETLHEDVAEVRRRWSLSPDEPVWIVDGGFDIGLASKLRRRPGAEPLRDFRSFDEAVIVFRAP